MATHKAGWNCRRRCAPVARPANKFIKLLDRDYKQISEFFLVGEGMVMDIALLSEPETRWLARLADAFERP